MATAWMYAQTYKIKGRLMTTRRVYALSCDVVPCGGTTDWHDSAWLARQAAKKAGWSRRQSRDYCNEHRDGTDHNSNAEQVPA